MVYTEIMPDLWVGDKDSIEDTIFLQKYKIDCIINCTKELNFKSYYTKAEIIGLDIHDSGHSTSFKDNMELYKKLEDIVEYIHNYLGSNKTVLVYSNLGEQRAPSVAAAYIIKYGCVSAKQAIEYIQSKHVKSFVPRVNFYIALQKFEKDFL